MNEDRDIGGLSRDEEELAHRLAELGPWMRAQEQAEAEITPEFARALRAQLVAGEEPIPEPRIIPRRRESVAARPARRPLASPRSRLAAGIGTILTAAVVSLVILLVNLTRPVVPAFRVPATTQADLLFNLPSSQTVVPPLRATITLIHPGPPTPYRGHLTLHARHIPTGPSTVRAYRLMRPINNVEQARVFLSIRSRARRISVDEGTWVVAQDGGGRTRRPIHSLALSLDSGELIYHDRRNFRLPHARRPIVTGDAVRIARSWLGHLGWPGYRMPVLAVGMAPGFPRVRQVAFGWAGVPIVAIPAATLWITPDGSVVEAWAWPSVARQTSMSAVSITKAWGDVRGGRDPLVVPHVPARLTAPGQGVLSRVVRTEILITKGKSGAYLVPAYRFAGSVRLHGEQRTQTWLSLTPGS